MAKELDELMEVQEHRLTMYGLIADRYTAEKKGDADLSAISAAAQALYRQQGDTVEVRILQYHASKAGALLFRDQNTMRALKAGFQALQRKEEELRKQCREIDS